MRRVQLRTERIFMSSGFLITKSVWPTYPLFPEAGVNYFVGLDLGKRQDPTALAVVERRERENGEIDRVSYERRREVLVNVRHLERLALGTSYVDVADYVGALVRRPELAGRCTLVVDATGVGDAVMELLRMQRMPGCTLVPVKITGGERESKEGSTWRVPKRDLIEGVQVMFEKQELGIAQELGDSEQLVTEMMNMRVTVGANGQELIDNWRTGTHDDLVFAVALACWQVRKFRSSWRRG
jgi:hypothetical protein